MGGPARSWLVSSGLLALLAGAPSRLLAQAAKPKEHEAPRLAGTWALDPSRSDRPEDRGRGGGMRGGFGGRGGGRGPGGFPGRPGGGWGGRQPGMNPDGGGENGGFDPRTIQEVMRPPARLVVTQTDSTVTVGEPGGQSLPRTYFTDARKVTETSLVAGGEPVTTTARWKKDKLKVERKLEAGTIQESYWIDRDTGALMVQVQFKGSRLPQAIERQRVYVPAPEGK